MTDRPPEEGIDAELLGRFLARECSEPEAAAVRRALRANPDIARTLDRVILHLDGGPSRPAPPPAAAFRTGALTGAAVTPRYPLVQEAAAPRRMAPLADGGYFVDFGRAAFGTLQLTGPASRGW